MLQDSPPNAESPPLLGAIWEAVSGPETPLTQHRQQPQAPPPCPREDWMLLSKAFILISDLPAVPQPVLTSRVPATPAARSCEPVGGAGDSVSLRSNKWLWKTRCADWLGPEGLHGEELRQRQWGKRNWRIQPGRWNSEGLRPRFLQGWPSSKPGRM